MPAKETPADDYNLEKYKKEKKEWKPAKNVSEVTIGLVPSKDDPTRMLPCGFRKDGKPGEIKNTCLISRIRELGKVNGTRPKLAICITMYNEDESELMITI